MYEIFELLLEEFGVTAADVSRVTGVGKSTLSAWKNGDYVPKDDKRQKIADYFGVSLAFLDGKTKNRTERHFDVEKFKQDFHDFAKEIYGDDLPKPRNIETASLIKDFEARVMGDDDGVSHEPYYSHPEVEQIAKKLYERRDLRILFDATKDLSKEDIEVVTRMLKGLNRDED